MNYYESNIGKRVSYKIATPESPFVEKAGVIVSVSADCSGNATYLIENGDIIYCDKCVITN